MNLLDWPLLADENRHPEVVADLRRRGARISTVHDEGLTGRTDREVLRRAVEQGRVILTHDSDFGTLALREGEPSVGIVYLRPGHIQVSFVVELLEAVLGVNRDVEPPFIVVAERRAGEVRLRVRSGPTD